MKKNILFLFLLLSTVINAQQYQLYQINLKGNTTASIDGATDVLSAVIPKGSTLTSCEIKVSHPTGYNSVNQNRQIVNSYNVYCSSNNFSRIEETDNYGNEYSKYTQTTSITSSFSVQQYYTAETKALLSNGFLSTASFPVTGIPANISAIYTKPSPNVESNDSYISSRAHSLTYGCTSMQDAVQKIAQWVIGEIKYYHDPIVGNTIQHASQVIRRGSGNCAGYTQLIIAMFRSVGIPARYVSGALLRYPYSVNNTIFTTPLKLGETGPGSHAVYEVYYPDKGEWVMADPQGSLNFIPTHFVAHQKLPDESYGGRVSANIGYTGTIMPTITPYDMCGTVTSFSNNFAIHNYSVSLVSG